MGRLLSTLRNIVRGKGEAKTISSLSEDQLKDLFGFSGTSWDELERIDHDYVFASFRFMFLYLDQMIMEGSEKQRLIDSLGDSCALAHKAVIKGHETQRFVRRCDELSR